jgi:hypothetical protein
VHARTKGEPNLLQGAMYLDRAIVRGSYLLRKFGWRKLAEALCHWLFATE